MGYSGLSLGHRLHESSLKFLFEICQNGLKEEDFSSDESLRHALLKLMAISDIHDRNRTVSNQSIDLPTGTDNASDAENALNRLFKLCAGITDLHTKGRDLHINAMSAFLKRYGGVAKGLDATRIMQQLSHAVDVQRQANLAQQLESIAAIELVATFASLVPEWDQIGDILSLILSHQRYQQKAAESANAST